MMTNVKHQKNIVLRTVTLLLLFLVCFAVQVSGQNRDLQVTKTVDNSNPAIGSNVIFTITARNNHSSSNATSVNVEDLLPSGFAYVSHTVSSGNASSYTPLTGVWNIGTLNSRTSRTLTITATVQRSGNYTNTATIRGSQNDPDLSNNTASVSVTPQNTTHAVDDYAETNWNTPVSGNVLTNDFDAEGDTQTVSNQGTRTTKEGGTIVISANGSYTYTPKPNFGGIDEFEYTVCDNRTPQACATATLIIGVGICKTEIHGNTFKWEVNTGTGTTTQSFTQPATNFGFVFDIYELDNSFNMQINGTKIAVHEIEFQSNGTDGINVRFADGAEYEKNTYKPDGTLGTIWEMRGNKANPMIRVVISPKGNVYLYGSKNSYGPLFPLVLTRNNNGPNSLNHVTWNSTGTNTIIVTQKLTGLTIMDGYGYGENIMTCTNYWMGGTPGKENEWSEGENWTDKRVPVEGMDVEFATVDNNDGVAAVRDLHLDKNRIIGNLINNSDKNLVITTGNQLTINGTVTDENTTAGTIIVKSSPTVPTGTLKFAIPANNQNVKATVEFYNKAYECDNCGFYRKQWQYFGTPVQSGDFPYQTPTAAEIVNQWVEPFNGNKWQPAPYLESDNKLKAFKGYQITNTTHTGDTPPTYIYSFTGTLNVGNASVSLTRTADVNYSGLNLVSNSYTAAIPINGGAMTFTNVVPTVYLFNAGTRDQWRKLNGSFVSGVAAGQYLSVPVNVAGQPGVNLPDRIPSMHAFMLEATASGTPSITIDYSKLVKNEAVNKGDGSGKIVTRSAQDEGSAPAVQQLPTLIMDVVGAQSADRIWIFAKEGTTHGFDNGWDGRKMEESGIAQLYVNASDNSKLQVATVPDMNNVSLGFVAEADGKYTFDFSLRGTLKGADLFLYDAVMGTTERVTDGGSYQFEAKKGETDTRFRLAYTGNNKFLSTEEALIDVSATQEGKIKVVNGSGRACSVFVNGVDGTHLQRLEVEPGSETEIAAPAGAGTYLIRLQNASVNDVRKVTVQ